MKPIVATAVLVALATVLAACVRVLRTRRSPRRTGRNTPQTWSDFVAKSDGTRRRR